MDIQEGDLSRIVMVGDRLLVKPKMPNDKTPSGLYLPPTVTEKEKIQSGYVMKVGPGYAIPNLADGSEPWMDKADEVKYVPLQPREGDLAVYLQNAGHEVQFKGETYLIISQSAILMLIRDEGLLK